MAELILGAGIFVTILIVGGALIGQIPGTGNVAGKVASIGYYLAIAISVVIVLGLISKLRG